MKAFVTYLLCFFVGALYCGCLVFQTPFYQNISTVLFIFFLASLFVLNGISVYSKQNLTIINIIFQLISLNLGIGIAAYFLKAPEGFFWVQDAVLTHLPESLKYLKFLNSGGSFSKVGRFPGMSTHFLSAFSMKIFGVNTFSTILAQLVFKVTAVYFIYKFCCSLWDKKVALIAAQVYGFCPTVFFYNLAFYKESAVHAYVAVCLFLTINVFYNKKKWHIIFYLIVLPLLFHERIYISILMLLMAPFFILEGIYNFKKSHFKIFIFSSLFLCLITVISIYFSFSRYSLIIDEVNALRSHYKSFSDVQNKYNYEISYMLAFVKILFSPYFTLNKFRIFNDFSTLLIWGSFINQAVIVMAIIGLYKSLKHKIIHLNLWIPFIAFLFAAAYISPWSGRLRDSFYPLLASYAAFALVHNKYFKKLFKIK